MSESFDVVVIGGGSAGSETAFRIGEGGRLKTGLVERDKLGGECNNYGCVPTKALLKAARVVRTARTAEPFGIRVRDVEVDFPKVMERVNRIVAHSTRYGTKPFEEIGVRVWLGPTATFANPQELLIDNERVRASKIVVATGTKAALPPIPGLRDATVWTNEEAVAQTALPSALAIIGGGPIGVEFAQIYARLGTRVTIIEAESRLLPPEDPASSAVIAEAFEAEGITVMTGAKVERVGSDNTVFLAGGASVAADAVLVATGRTPSFALLDPDAAGIEMDGKGKPVVDESLRTSQRHVYACGDATGELLFTHVASYEGALVARQIETGRRARADYRVIPKVTYCDPEVASVGISEKDAAEQGRDVRIATVEFADNERAGIDAEDRGMVKVVADGATGEVLGAAIAGAGAGEMIHEIVAIMALRGKAKSPGKAIHAYPTLSESVKGALEQVAT